MRKTRWYSADTDTYQYLVMSKISIDEMTRRTKEKIRSGVTDADELEKLTARIIKHAGLSQIIQREIGRAKVMLKENSARRFEQHFIDTCREFLGKKELDRVFAEANKRASSRK